MLPFPGYPAGKGMNIKLSSFTDSFIVLQGYFKGFVGNNNFFEIGSIWGVSGSTFWFSGGLEGVSPPV